jgi:hypothetical protein
MAPILKESELYGTATETLAPSTTTVVAEPQPKSQPVALEVTVTVNGARAIAGSDKREPFSEVTKTVLVLGNGAVIRLSSPVSPGQLLFLTNERTKKEVVCQVVKSKNYRNVSGYVELEFTESVVGFWGMRFPGDRIGSGGTPPAAAPPVVGSTPGSARSVVPQPPAPRVQVATPRIESPVVSSAPVGKAQPMAPVVREVSPQLKIESRPAQQQVKQAAPQLDPAEQAAAFEQILSQTVAPVAPASPVSKVPAPVTPVPEVRVDPELPVLSSITSTSARTPSAPLSSASFDPEVPALEPFFKPEVAVAVVPPPPVSIPDLPVQTVEPASAPPIVAEAAAKPITPLAPKSQVAHDPETEALRQQAARLQEQLSTLLFTDAPASAASPASSNAPSEKPAAAPDPVKELPVSEKPNNSHVPFSDKEVDLAELLELTAAVNVVEPESSSPIVAEEILAPVRTAAEPESVAAISLEEISALGAALNAVPVEEFAELSPVGQDLPSAPVVEQPDAARPVPSINVDDLLESVHKAPEAETPSPEPTHASELITGAESDPAPEKIAAKLDVPPAP